MRHFSRPYGALFGTVVTALLLVASSPGHAQLACGLAGAPACDGACPTGQDCEEQSGLCICKPSTNPCGVDAGAPLCYGLCPPANPICADIGGTCQCVGGATPTPTATATMTAGGPTATATVTAIATPGAPTATPTPATSTTPSCAVAPIAGCRTPAAGQKAFVQIKKYDPSLDDKDRLTWKWLKGSATSKSDFGDPLGSTSYVLCAYDAGLSLILSSAAIGGDSCQGVPCWQEKTKGFVYKDKDKSPSGPQRILLKEGAAGKAQIIVQGKGSDLDPPSPPLTQPVTVQLVNSNGICWEAVYSAPALKNVAGPPGLFKDKAD